MKEKTAVFLPKDALLFSPACLIFVLSAVPLAFLLFFAQTPRHSSDSIPRLTEYSPVFCGRFSNQHSHPGRFLPSDILRYTPCRFDESSPISRSCRMGSTDADIGVFPADSAQSSPAAFPVPFRSLPKSQLCSC